MSKLLVPVDTLESFPLGADFPELRMVEYDFPDGTTVAQAIAASEQPDVPTETFYQAFHDGNQIAAPEEHQPWATPIVVGSLLQAAVSSDRPDIASGLVPYLHLED